MPVLKKTKPEFAIGTLMLIAASPAGSAPGTATPSEKRQAVDKMQEQVMADLYKSKVKVRGQIASARGCGVFTNANVHVFLVSADNVTVYPLAERGLALQATIKGTRFRVDPELNGFCSSMDS